MHENCIKCSVSNCKYHSNDECQAKSIEVGPHYANSSADTICVTFKAKAEC